MANPVDLLRERGFLYQCTDEPALKAAFDQGRITVYAGYDLTAASLHIGSLVTIMMLSHLQRAGHRPLVIVGGGTTRVGDPSGKTAMRQMLSPTRIEEHKQGIKRVLARFIRFGDGPSDAVMVDNADWLLDLNYIDFLREVGVHFSVNRMLSAESVQIRLEKGLSFIEFNYQILQAYDFRVLHQQYGCTLQVGGADQWGNIVAGIELGRRMDGAQLFGLTAPLIMTASGEKMGKSAKGAVWLSRDMLSAFDFYQYWLNVHDDDVERFLALFTFLPMDEVRRLGALKGAESREAKKVLAAEVTRVVHGDAGVAEAEKATAATFGGGGAADGVPVHEVPRAELDAGLPAFALFADAGLAKSRGAARRLLSQGGGYCNGQRITAFDQLIGTAQQEDGRIELRAGKKSFVHVVAED